MPIYEYRCKKCEHVEEVLQNRTDPAPAKCPECNARKSMARAVSLTSFQLKGGGWYADGYGSVPDESKADKAVKADKPAKKDSKKTEKKNDKKPAKKTKKKASKKGSGQAA